MGRGAWGSRREQRGTLRDLRAGVCVGFAYSVLVVMLAGCTPSTRNSSESDRPAVPTATVDPLAEQRAPGDEEVMRGDGVCPAGGVAPIAATRGASLEERYASLLQSRGDHGSRQCCHALRELLDGPGDLAAFLEERFEATQDPVTISVLGIMGQASPSAVDVLTTRLSQVKDQEVESARVLCQALNTARGDKAVDAILEHAPWGPAPYGVAPCYGVLVHRGLERPDVREFLAGKLLTCSGQGPVSFHVKTAGQRGVEFARELLEGKVTGNLHADQTAGAGLAKELGSDARGLVELLEKIRKELKRSAMPTEDEEVLAYVVDEALAEIASDRPDAAGARAVPGGALHPCSADSPEASGDGPAGRGKRFRQGESGR